MTISTLANVKLKEIETDNDIVFLPLCWPVVLHIYTNLVCFMISVIFYWISSPVFSFHLLMAVIYSLKHDCFRVRKVADNLPLTAYIHTYILTNLICVYLLFYAFGKVFFLIMATFMHRQPWGHEPHGCRGLWLILWTELLHVSAT